MKDNFIFRKTKHELDAEDGTRGKTQNKEIDRRNKKYAFIVPKCQYSKGTIARQLYSESPVEVTRKSSGTLGREQ